MLTIYVYDDAKWEETLELVDGTSPYALTGAVFANDRGSGPRRRWRPCGTRRGTSTSTTSRPVRWSDSSRSAAPGPAGTNDKAGSYLNLIRWVSARSVKETFVPAHDYRYPFMKPGKTEAAADALEDIGEKLGVQIEELKGHLGALGGSLKERLEGAVDKSRTDNEGKKIDVEAGDDADSN